MCPLANESSCLYFYSLISAAFSPSLQFSPLPSLFEEEEEQSKSGGNLRAEKRVGRFKSRTDEIVRSFRPLKSQLRLAGSLENGE